MSQQLFNTVEQDSVSRDSTQNPFLLQFIGDGYFPTKYFNFDLRYLVKFNQYEGFRTGLGGVTNQNFSTRYRLNGYTVYGFRDHRFKYSFGGGFRISPKRNTWINLAYTDDLEESGSSGFLTDKRLFQLFEPRLLNIDLFHAHISKTLNIEHQIFFNVVAETEFAVRKIKPTYDYSFVLNNSESYFNYNISTFKITARWSPFSTFDYVEKSIREIETGYPNFTFQYTKAFKDVFNGDLNFSKLDLRVVHNIDHVNSAKTELTLIGGLANGDVPLQFVYHAYPNNVNKETIMSRFSIAGINSFETMYFNEFFSDRFATLILKHRLPPFKISPNFKPELVLLTKMAIGTLDNIGRHQNVTFDTLEHGFTESGIELNKLLFGFGLSFTYRYGAYHLPDFDDNIAFKFTFNLSF
ncbi:MAG: hypothetical protein HKN00_00905 [Flavobacteriaceae bacterium]|nr:hypothetical protein [Bacteroidia bacterium]MBT8288305.1 hypothetical protein [Bacteroidia bacterium]NNF73715.1 hypothetical protein [Flavobacteriaceae bacterium]NNK71967.1 hypothetical protein [Flavobacteriaceae bacterium]